jgi:hypothetical protein
MPENVRAATCNSSRSGHTLNRSAIYFPALFTVLCCIAMIAHGPIAQSESYHAFADHADFMGIPHARDVTSNLGFAIVGLWGILKLWPQRRHPGIVPGEPGYALFLIGLTLTALGSSYYHLAPDNARLVWDRLPIALACTGLLAGVWAETALPQGRAFMATSLLALFSIASVLWWYFTELNGQGDLRPYLLLQILPIVLIPLWQAIYRSATKDRLWFGAAILLYIFAKLAEVNDEALLATTNRVISGHTLKHLLATAAAAALAHRLIQRTQVKRGDHSDSGTGLGSHRKQWQSEAHPELNGLRGQPEQARLVVVRSDDDRAPRRQTHVPVPGRNVSPR